jgi:acetyl esterase/lipase
VPPLPSPAAWRYARRLGVPVSLRAFLADARRPNVGGPHPERTVVFGVAADGTALELDVWPATGDPGAPRPAIVKLHGGGWTDGARNEAEQWNRWLNGIGYHVFDVEYRLAPPARWQDEVGDVKAALGWVADRASDYQVDRARISLMGLSAGGNLAMLAAYSADDRLLPPSCPRPVPAVRCVVNFYGPCDLTRLYGASPSGDYVDECLRQYIGGSPAEHPDRYRAVSPLTHVSASAAPTMTVMGRRDRTVPLEQAQLLDDALSQVGVPHETWLLPGCGHSFDVHWGGFGTQIVRPLLQDFLGRHG